MHGIQEKVGKLTGCGPHTLGPEAASSTVALGETGCMGSSGQCTSHCPRFSLSPTFLTLSHPTGSSLASVEPKAVGHPCVFCVSLVGTASVLHLLAFRQVHRYAQYAFGQLNSFLNS